ncbi:hypothetical protein [Ralstonia insidiosa]|jgi:hypothetical protein|nr:hypothetical protein [Ralstonia insidiosa]MBX3904390.1 hypothetical protein [Ralstonia insidiosa]
MNTLLNLIGWVLCKLHGGKHVPVDAGPASSNADYTEIPQKCRRCGKQLPNRYLG